jgi:hypothetical protein
MAFQRTSERNYMAVQHFKKNDSAMDAMRFLANSAQGDGKHG